MSEALIRQDIKATLEGVYQIGCVYDYETWSSTWDQYLNQYKVTIDEHDVIRGWTITVTEITVTGFIAGGIRNTSNIRTYNYSIKGYYGLSDAGATEKEHLKLALTVMDALDARALTSTTLGSITNAGVAQLVSFGVIPFGDALCHYAEITQTITEST